MNTNCPVSQNPAARQLPRVMAVGVGHGGCQAARAMARIWPADARVALLDTDGRSLDPADDRCLQIGGRVIRGMGTGGEPRVGQRAAKSDMDRIRAIFKDTDLVFMAVGLGGGTGTGAAPLIVNEARQAGAFTVALASLPFRFEGPRRMEIATGGLRAIQAVADMVITLPNERLMREAPDRSNIAAVFRAADDALAESAQAIWRIVSGRGVLPLGMEEMRAVASRGQGRCLLISAEGSGTDKVDQALDGIKQHVLLGKGTVLATADAFLVSIMGGTDLTLRELDQIMQAINAQAGSGTLTATGLCCRAEWSDRLLVALLVAEQPAAEPAAPLPAAVTEQTGLSAPATPKMTQAGLFDTIGRSRFTDAEPTVINGTDLDSPTYLRRGILIQKAQRDSLL